MGKKKLTKEELINKIKALESLCRTHGLMKEPTLMSDIEIKEHQATISILSIIEDCEVITGRKFKVRHKDDKSHQARQIVENLVHGVVQNDRQTEKSANPLSTTVERLVCHVQYGGAYRFVSGESLGSWLKQQAQKFWNEND